MRERAAKSECLAWIVDIIVDRGEVQGAML